MIDLVTGFAPAEWQSGVANMVVARADGGMLDTGTLAAITGVGAARKYYSRARLDKFIVDHGKMQGQYKEILGEDSSG